VKYYKNYFSLFIPFFANLPTGQTSQWIFDGSNEADSQKDVLFGFGGYCTISRPSNSPKTVFQPFAPNTETSIF